MVQGLEYTLHSFVAKQKKETHLDLLFILLGRGG